MIPVDDGHEFKFMVVARTFEALQALWNKQARLQAT